MTEPARPARIMVLVGSLRQASINRQLARAAAAQAPPGVVMEPFDRIDELPWYN
jgi:NAD(P)H-dependent FMN reductase